MIEGIMDMTSKSKSATRIKSLQAGEGKFYQDSEAIKCSSGV